MTAAPSAKQKSTPISDSEEEGAAWLDEECRDQDRDGQEEDEDQLSVQIALVMKQ